MESLKYDPTSPLFTNVTDEIASVMANMAPGASFSQVSTTSSENMANKTKEYIKKYAITSAASLGITFDPLHLEDLYCISRSKGPLSEHNIWMYLRGVMRTNQITADQTQLNIVQSVDSNRLVLERLTQLSTKIDGCVAILLNNIKAEHKEEESSSRQKKIHHANPKPEMDEMRQIMRVIGMPETMIEEKAPKYVGKVKWSEYEKITSGNLSKKECLKIIVSWKDRL